jgi:hypothetical protein
MNFIYRDWSIYLKTQYPELFKDKGQQDLQGAKDENLGRFQFTPVEQLLPSKHWENAFESFKIS